MANPQIENGHTQIANELLEAICKMPLSNYESRVFWYIIRKTYGYKKKLDWIAQKQIADGTGIHKPHVSRTIKMLLEKKMITRDKKHIGVQKDYDLWKLPKMVTHKKLPELVSEVTPIGNKKLPVQAPQKKRKKLIQKDKFLDSVYLAKDEYQKLLNKFGNATTQDKIEDLDLYIGSTGRKYKSHYKTILQWDKKKKREQTDGFFRA